jgi:DNA-binding MarR family transcriptional regulator
MKTLTNKKILPEHPDGLIAVTAVGRRGTRPELVAQKLGAGVIAPALSNVLGYLLRRSHNAFQSYWMNTFYSPLRPITSVQAGMMVVIGATPGLTQTELAKIMNVEGPTLMQSIDRLEQNGFLTREPRVGDRRSNSLKLSTAGIDMLENINDFLPDRDAALFVRLNRPRNRSIGKDFDQDRRSSSRVFRRSGRHQRCFQETQQCARLRMNLG